MKTTVLLLNLFFVSLHCSVVDKKPPITTIRNLTVTKFEPRIINGSPAVAGQFPWQAALFLHASPTQQGFCGGTLINERFILTAAHCASNIPEFTVHLGAINVQVENEAGRITIQATESTVHRDYNPLTLVNDIAIIKLPENSVTFSDRIATIPLAPANDYLGSGVAVTVSGWGKTSDASNTISSTLNYVRLITIPNPECLEVYGPQTIITSTVCCRGAPNHSTCNGDSGGPLVQEGPSGTFTHVGIVSFVHRDGCASGNPSGYIRTSSYRQWIEDVMNGRDPQPEPEPDTTTPDSAASLRMSMFGFLLLAVLKFVAY